MTLMLVDSEVVETEKRGEGGTRERERERREREMRERGERGEMRAREREREKEREMSEQHSYLSVVRRTRQSCCIRYSLSLHVSLHTSVFMCQCTSTSRNTAIEALSLTCRNKLDTRLLTRTSMSRNIAKFIASNFT